MDIETTLNKCDFEEAIGMNAISFLIQEYKIWKILGTILKMYKKHF